MRTPSPAPTFTACASHGWVGLLLLPFLFSTACKPREVVCKSQAFFQASEPERGAGKAPFSIGRLGPEVKGADLELRPTFITFMSGNRARTGWLARGHVSSYVEMDYLPGERLAHNAGDPSDVHPLERLADGSSERVRLGFRSSTCRDADELAGKVPCRKYGEEELFLVADMPCEQR